VSDRTLRLVVAALATGGAAVAAYLTYARFTHTAIACTTGGCETVQSSGYAEVAGIPVALLGLGLYVAILATAFSTSELARAGAAAIALAGRRLQRLPPVRPARTHRRVVPLVPGKRRGDSATRDRDRPPTRRRPVRRGRTRLRRVSTSTPQKGTAAAAGGSVREPRGAFRPLPDGTAARPRRGAGQGWWGGACHSDLHVMEWPAGSLPYELPFTLGHENAGWVEAVGAGVEGFAPGATSIRARPRR